MTTIDESQAFYIHRLLTSSNPIILRLIDIDNSTDVNKWAVRIDCSTAS
jgi:hypothetical protein